MLNTINLGSNSQSITLNTPSSGMMQRSHPKSIFIRFQKGSVYEEYVFPNSGDRPKMMNGKYHFYDISVLQVMVFGQDQFLVEVVRDKDLTND